MGMTKAFLRLGALTLIGLLAAVPVAAQGPQYPVRAVHLVVPYTAGGATDVLARIVAESLSGRLGQPVIVENRPGAGAVLATAQVAKAAPDGYTLLFTTLAHSINATLNKQLPFDPVNDFEFIGKVGQLTFAIIVNPALGAPDLRSLVDLMRANPGKYQFASAGVGSPMHLGAELLKHLTRTDAMHIPTKGETVALSDLLGGRVAFMLCSITTCASRIQDGSIKAVAVTSASRSQQVPRVPSAAEAGVPGLETYSWFVILAPRGTPNGVITRVSGALNGALQDSQVRSRMEAMGIEADRSSTPEGTRTYVQSEIDKWRPIILSTKAASE
jgi:tripartite-type tricarboxylate transporter receptor subunit TctC